MKFADGNGYLNILVYVLIAIVVLASNAYRSYVKSKEQQNRIPGGNLPDFPDVDFEPVFDYGEPGKNEAATTEEEIIPEYEPVAMSESYRRLDEAVSAVEANPVEQPIDEGQAAFQSTMETVLADSQTYSGDKTDEQEQIRDIISLSEIGDVKDSVETETFDLERAVIYSEILRPKYFSIRY